MQTPEDPRVAPAPGHPPTHSGVPRLGSVPVFVRDQQRALEFYRDKLKFQVLMDIPLSGGKRWIAVAREAGETELILYHPASFAKEETVRAELDARVGTWTGIVFLTDDIQHTYRAMHERGVVFETEPKRQPWGGWEAFFQDSEGNRFHLAQRPEGMPA